MSKTTPVAPAAKAEEPKTEKVKLIADHTHCDKPCKAGDEIEVTEREKAWLIRHEKVADPAKPATTAPAKE